MKEWAALYAHWFSSCACGWSGILKVFQLILLLHKQDGFGVLGLWWASINQVKYSRNTKVNGSSLNEQGTDANYLLSSAVRMEAGGPCTRENWGMGWFCISPCFTFFLDLLWSHPERGERRFSIAHWLVQSGEWLIRSQCSVLVGGAGDLCTDTWWPCLFPSLKLFFCGLLLVRFRNQNQPRVPWRRQVSVMGRRPAWVFLQGSVR